MTEKKIQKLIKNDEEPVRLDKFLLTQFPEYSRSFFQQIINKGIVTVNTKPVSKSSTLLKMGDSIQFYFPVASNLRATPQPVDFQIIDEQKDFIVINKPAGLLVHMAHTASTEKTLVDGLLYHYKELQSFDESVRPGIVHRLDKDTSGLMLIARTTPGHIELARMFKEHLVEKTYLAVVNKKVQASGRIDLPIGRHPSEGHKMSHLGFARKPATTFYTPVKRYKNATLLSVRIITGRTHQIRVHCAAIGHGLLGDAIYGFNNPLINRQALHSWKLSFEYKGQRFNYNTPVPQDLKKLLIALNKSLSEKSQHPKKFICSSNLEKIKKS